MNYCYLLFVFITSLGIVHAENRTKMFKVNKEVLRQLWYTATLRGLIKAKARACFDSVPEIEKILYKSCEKAANETTQLARCAVQLFDARDREVEKRRAFVIPTHFYATNQQYLSGIPNNRAKSSNYKLKSQLWMKIAKKKKDTSMEVVLEDFRKEINPYEKEARLSKVDGFYSMGQEKENPMFLRRRRFRREIAAQPLMPLTKKSVDYSKLAGEYFSRIMGQQDSYPHVDKLEEIKNYLDKATRIKDYYSLINKENSKLFSKMSFPFHNEDPQMERNGDDLLEHVLGIVNDFAATHLTSDSKFSILSPRLFSIFPDQQSEHPKLLSPTVFSFHKDGFFSLPNLFEIVSSNQGYQKMMLELILDISGAGQALEGVLTHIQKEMEDVNTIHYPLIQEMSRHDRNWLRAQRSFSPTQKEAYTKNGFAYLNEEQTKMVYDNVKFTSGGAVNITDLSRKSIEQREEELEQHIREIAKSDQKLRFKRAGSHPKPGATINGVHFYTLQPMAFTSFIGEGTTMNAITLSPQFFVLEVLSTATMAQLTLSPEAMFASILTPIALVSRVLSPVALRADILSPRAFHPWVLSPGALVTEILVPKAFEPRVLSPEVLVIHVLSPNFISPSVGSGETFGLIILSPHFLSPRVASEEHFLVEVLSPHILGGTHGKHDSTVISIPKKEHDHEHQDDHASGNKSNTNAPH